MSKVKMRIRMPNFTPYEKALLCRLIKKRPIIEERTYDGKAVETKRLAWLALCTEFNSHFDVNTKRDLKTLKKAWENMKATRKDRTEGREDQASDAADQSEETALEPPINDSVPWHLYIEELSTNVECKLEPDAEHSSAQSSNVEHSPEEVLPPRSPTVLPPSDPVVPPSNSPLPTKRYRTKRDTTRILAQFQEATQKFIYIADRQTNILQELANSNKLITEAILRMARANSTRCSSCAGQKS